MALKLLHVGLGPLGRRIQSDLAASELAKGRIELAAVVDTDPEVAGRRLVDLVPLASDRVRVKAGLDEVLDHGEVEAAIVTTSSDLARCAPTFRALLERGIRVVSTCEELVWPYLRHADLARELHELALASDAALLGAGVNPGFLMDAWPAFATGLCTRVNSVQVERYQDATERRVPFQRKIGAGLDRAAFDARVADGSLRHVGLGESLHLLASALGFAVERWSEAIEPVIADRPLECALGTIAPGHAAGVRQTARAWIDGEPRLALDFQAAIGEREPRDRVRIDGDPPLDILIRGGVNGDTATSALAVNALPSLMRAPPGLHTMASVPPVGCWIAGARLSAP